MFLFFEILLVLKSKSVHQIDNSDNENNVIHALIIITSLFVYQITEYKYINMGYMWIHVINKNIHNINIILTLFRFLLFETLLYKN